MRNIKDKQNRYNDGYRHGNSDINYYDKKRFQDDDEYEKGLRDGWREKERREEAARNEQEQKAKKEIDDAYADAWDNSKISTSQNRPSGHTSSSTGFSEGCFTVMMIAGVIFWILFCLFFR